MGTLRLPAEGTHTQEETASEEDEERVVSLERPATAMRLFCNAEEPPTRPVSPSVGDPTTSQSEGHSLQLQQEAHVIHDVEDTSPSIPPTTPSHLHENNDGSDQIEETEQDLEGSVGDSDPSECNQPDEGKVDVPQYDSHTSENELETHNTACCASGSEQDDRNGTNVYNGEEKEHKSKEDYAPTACQSASGEHTTTGGESFSSPLGGEMRERERAVELLELFRNSNDAEHHYLLDEFIAAFESPVIVLLDGSIRTHETDKRDDEDEEDNENVFEEESSLGEGYRQTTSNWRYTHLGHILEPITEEEEDSEDGSLHCSASFSALASTAIPEGANPNADAAEGANQAGESGVLEASVKSISERRPLRLQNGRTHGWTHLHRAPCPSNRVPRGGKENLAP